MDSLPDLIFRRIDAKILSLAGNPRPAGCKKLKGLRDVWRIRVGSYRVLYGIEDTKKVVTILAVGHRRQIYE
jgi:mRNA interferase RelE/StbE